MSNSQIFCFDFTLGDNHADFEDLKLWLSENCKKWCFQLELGESTGWVHWQGRFSLKAKTRLLTLKDRMPWEQIHLSPTAKMNQGNDYYVSKEDTRLDGPWRDTDKVEYIPSHLQISNWFPWEITVLQMMDQAPGRTINLIYETNGNVGKSTFVGFLSCKNLACEIPFCNDYRDIMRMVMGFDKSKCYFIDMPRAVGKEKLRQLYGAIESIKNGYAYDDRYRMRAERFEQPHVFVFTNSLPDLDYCSPDRWNLWTINKDNKELTPYIINQPVNYLQVTEVPPLPYVHCPVDLTQILPLNH